MRGILISLAFAACAPAEIAKAPEPDTDTDTDTDPTVEPVHVATLAGDITWNVDFGPDSEAAGSADCAYARTYSGVEDRSAPWLCAGCEDLFRADIVLSAGTDCYGLVTSAEPTPIEWIGYGAGLWYRGGASYMTERGPAARDETTLTVSQEVDSTESGGDFAFDIQGTLSIGETVGDPLNGFVAAESYACGWPKADPAPYAGDYVAAIGAVLPDGVFTDVCEEPVRLHDFAGEYLIIDVSAIDCPPCQAAAADEGAFVEALAGEGIAVHVVTLLAPSLSDTAGTPTHAQIDAWTTRYALRSPVLADRVWGLVVAGVPLGDEFGYPTFIVVDRDLQILDLEVGYSSFDAMAETIRADAG